MTRMGNKDWNKEAVVAETHSLDSEEDLVASVVEAVLEVDLPSLRQMTFSNSSLVAVILSRISLMMTLS